MNKHILAAIQVQFGKPPAPYMKLGVNLSGVSTWANAWMFNNLMYHSTYPERTSGTGTFTSNQGILSSSDSTSVYRYKFSSDQSKLPAGDYTVLNPNGDLIAIGDYGEPSSGSFTTATQFTFNLPVGNTSTAAKSLFVKGSLTGNVAVILPGCLPLWQSGNIWNPQFLTFLQGMHPSILRTMDWNIASDNIETEWSDRTVPNKPCIHSAATKYGGGCVPYEFMLDLAGRIGSDVWINVPHRASDNYLTNLGNLINTNLPAGRRVWIEPVGNEIWNGAAPWILGTLWMDFYTFTRRTAMPDVANNRYTLAGHGLVNASQIICFDTIENRATLATRSWQLATGGAYVKVVDADTFEVYAESALTTRLSVGTDPNQKLLFVVELEPGKTRDMNSGYSAKATKVFDALDGIVGSSRIVHLIASQVANSSTASWRWAYPGISSRADYLAGAPYFSGAWFGASITPSDGGLSIGYWGNLNATMDIAVYAAGATPTNAEVVAGTGAIAKQSYSFTKGASTYSTAATFTGLTTGTTYSVHAVIVTDGLTDRLSGTAIASAASGVSYLNLSYARQALRNKISTFNNRTSISSNQAVCTPKKAIFYECGLHFHETAPANIKTWLNGYVESTEMQSAVRAHLQDAANQGVAAACYFSDVSTTMFRLADEYSDTVDLKYLAASAYSGKVTKKTLLAQSDILAPNVTTRPASFPAVISALPASPLVCSVIDGDPNGNFGVSGSNLVMLNDNGIDWETPSSRAPRVSAQDGDMLVPFYVRFATGNAWYEVDSIFAFDATTDTDTAQMDPKVSVAVVPKTSANAAVASGGMWDMDTATYAGSPLKSVLSLNSSPFLIAAVLDRDNHTATYSTVFQVGVGGGFITYRVSTSASTDFIAQAYYNSTTTNVPFISSGSISSGKHVLWVYFDGAGTLTAGVDQASGGSVNKGTSTTAISNNIYVGCSGSSSTPASAMKHGSIQILQRTGMTMADAKAIVAKMQTLHGIP